MNEHTQPASMEVRVALFERDYDDLLEDYDEEEPDADEYHRILGAWICAGMPDSKEFITAAKRPKEKGGA